jgi:hypothetical protein
MLFRLLSVAAPLTFAADVAWAGITVPELDSSSALSGVAMALGVILLYLESRRRG